MVESFGELSVDYDSGSDSDAEETSYLVIILTGILDFGFGRATSSSRVGKLSA